MKDELMKVRRILLPLSMMFAFIMSLSAQNSEYTEELNKYFHIDSICKSTSEDTFWFLPTGDICDGLWIRKNQLWYGWHDYAPDKIICQDVRLGAFGCEGNFMFGDITILPSIELNGESIPVREVIIPDQRYLTSLTIPSSVRRFIAPSYTSCIKHITMEEGLEVFRGLYKIRKYEYESEDDYTIKEIIFPQSVRIISPKSLCECYDLEKVILPDGLTKLYDKTLSKNPKLRDITLPSALKYIGEEVLSECNSLTEIKIPDGVDSILNKAFYFCENLKEVTLPNHKIHLQKAFHNCRAIETIWVRSMEAYEIDTRSFNRVDFEKCRLMVPPGTKEKYQTTKGWDRFQNIIESMTGIDTIHDDKSNPTNGTDDVSVYRIDGRYIGSSSDNLTPGVYIIRDGNTARKIFVK